MAAHRLLLVIATLSLAGRPAWATDFFVDPVAGSTAGDGSAAKPWKSVQEVIDGGKVETQGWSALPYSPGATLVKKNAGAPVKAGDTIYLRSGYHGTLTVTGHYNAGVITVAAAPGQQPQLAKVTVRSSAKWTLRGLQVSPSFAPTFTAGNIVTVEPNSSSGPVEEIVVEDCSVFAIADASKWTPTDWGQKAGVGFQVGGSKITIRRNTVKNVNYGMAVPATGSLIEHNTIDGFGGDGLRGLGNNTTFQYNVVKNCYDVTDEHHDGFQSWTVGSGGVGTGEVVGIVLRGNRFINYENPQQPYRATMQAIGCFDGTFVDWVIENNVIVTDHWHGITLLGAKGSRIVNNTVIDPNTTAPGPPWIQIGAHKNGTAPTGCVVRNNLTTSLNNATSGVTADHNILVKDAALLFVNAAALDLHLIPTAAAVDSGSPTLAPAIDLDGVPRPQKNGFDVGAYEWSASPPPKKDGAVATDGKAVTTDGTARAEGAAGPPPETAPAGDLAGGAGDPSPSPPGDGCGCAVTPGPASLLPALLLVGLLRRRWR